MNASALCSTIRSINKAISNFQNYERENGRSFEDENLQKNSIAIIEHIIDACKIKYGECDRLFDEIMNTFQYYGKNMCHDIYDKIYSYDEITNNGKSIYNEKINSINSDFSKLYDLLQKEILKIQ